MSEASDCVTVTVTFASNQIWTVLGSQATLPLTTVCEDTRVLTIEDLPVVYRRWLQGEDE